MFKWILKLIPTKYSWTVAIKKVSYTIAKLVVAGLTFFKSKDVVSDTLTPDLMIQIQTTVALAVSAILEGLHDWARMKWPDVKWL